MDALDSTMKKIKTRVPEIHPFDFFILVYAFLYGNIFTVQYSTMRWGFLVIFGLVFFLEISQKGLYLLSALNNQKPFLKFSFFFLNILKRGVLLGFFVEAFKVGS